MLSTLSCHFSHFVFELQWFERKVPADSDEELTITKFKAHAAYKKKNYQQAASLYKACAKLLPSNANLVLREVGESRARCLLKLGRLEDCEQLLLSLLGEKGNPQDSSLKALLSDIYMAQGKLDEAATCLRQCLTLHPEYSQYWVKIADVFENLASSVKCFIRHCSRNDCKEAEAFTDVWYFVNVLKKCYFTGNNVENNDKRHLEKKSQVNLYDYKWHELFGFTWERFNRDIKSILLTEGIPEEIIPAVDSSYFEIRLEPTSLSSYLNGEDFQESFSFPNNSISFNKLVSQMEPAELQQLIFTHFFSWYHIMMLSHCLALGKAWQLLRKTVQYSKGFAKEVEQRSLLEIKERLATITGCQEITDWLIKVSEASSPAGKV